MAGTYYNGYSSPEREAKYQVMLDRISSGELANPSGPCLLCRDSDVPVVYHDEDYSMPYLWEPPALLRLCRNCHTDKIHKRFVRPLSHWQAFLAHVRRGGYARELKCPAVKTEIAACRQAFEAGEPFSMRQLRAYEPDDRPEWFAHLRMDLASKTDPAARPRP